MQTKTASQFAKEINDEQRAWLAANPGGWVTMMVEDQDFWEKQGIVTAEDLDRAQAIDTYSDTFKETHGFRPRMRDWTGVPTEQIWAAVRDL